MKKQSRRSIKIHEKAALIFSKRKDEKTLASKTNYTEKFFIRKFMKKNNSRVQALALTEQLLNYAEEHAMCPLCDEDLKLNYRYMPLGPGNPGVINCNRNSTPSRFLNWMYCTNENCDFSMQ